VGTVAAIANHANTWPSCRPAAALDEVQLAAIVNNVGVQGAWIGDFTAQIHRRHVGNLSARPGLDHRHGHAGLALPANLATIAGIANDQATIDFLRALLPSWTRRRSPT